MFKAMLVAFSSVSLAINPVSELNITQYLGRWYQVYGDLAIFSSVQNNSYCTTGDYGLYPNGTISVHNRERYGSVTGEEVGIKGWAEVKDPTKPGELSVVLQTPHPSPAPYWVYALGPVVDGLYDYSVVSDNLLIPLFVLTRNVTRFAAEYDSSVLKFLASSGFTKFYNKPIPLIQAGCTYWD